MFRKALRHIGLLVLSGFLSAHAYAIGLGEIQLKSTLNEPLSADIQLLEVKGLSENEILVGIAPKADFEAAGVDRLFFLSSLKFALDLNNPKGPLVHVTTDVPVREPYLDFLLEVQWPSGRLLREYTLLMDLPAGDTVSKASVIKGTEVPAAKDNQKTKPTRTPVDEKELEAELAAVDSTTTAVPVSATPAAAPAPAPAAEAPSSKKAAKHAKPMAAAGQEAMPVAKHKKTKVMAAKKHEPVKQAEEAKPAAVEPAAPAAGQNVDHTVVPVYGSTEGNYTVKSGDSLWAIAMKYRSGFSVQQSMLAIQHGNPDAFANSNINQLKKGKVLRLPTHDELASITPREAIDEVRKQNMAWSGNAHAKKAATAAPEQIDATRQTAEAETAAPEKQEGRLKLSVPGNTKGASTGKASGAAEAKAAMASLQNELSIAMEELDRHKHEKANVSGQLSALDEQTKTMQQMLDVRNAELAALQESMAKKAAEQKAAEAVAAQQPVETTPAQAPATQESATPAPAEQAPVAKTEPAPQPAPAPAETAKSAPAEASSNVGWIAGGVVVLVLLFVIIAKLRGRESEVDLAAQIEEEIKKAAPVAEAQPAPVAAPAPAPVPPPAPAPAKVEEKPAPVVVERAPVVKEVAAPAPIAPAVAAPVVPPPVEPVVETKPKAPNPIDEADIYISFGTYDKAENILKGAISAEPKRTDLRLKLLEVYVGTENLKAFDDQLAQLAGLNDRAAVDSANKMRSKIAAPAPVAAPVAKAAEPPESDLHLDLELAEDISAGVDTNLGFDSNITAKSSVIKPVELDQGLDLESLDQKPSISEAPTVQQRALDISKLKTGASPAIQVSHAKTEVREAFDAVAPVVPAKPEPVKTPPADKIDLDLDLEFASEVANEPTVRTPKLDISDSPTIQQRALDISQLKTLTTPAVQVGEAKTEVRESVSVEKAKPDSSTAVTGTNEVVSLDEDLDFSVDADEVATKLDLAKAYIDMGDKEGAKDILQEVLEEGQPAQKDEAKKLLASIG